MIFNNVLELHQNWIFTWEFTPEIPLINVPFAINASQRATIRSSTREHTPAKNLTYAIFAARYVINNNSQFYFNVYVYNYFLIKRKGFAQSSVLKTHMRLHTGRPEVCNICNKRFCRPAELRLHMRRHTGEKPYLCVECGQGFIQRSHLTEHVKIHTGERPYKCTHCNKAFKQSSSLKSHVFLHLGVSNTNNSI